MSRVSAFEIQKGDQILCEVIPVKRTGKGIYKGLFRCSKRTGEALPPFEEIWGIEARDLRLGIDARDMSLANMIHGNPRIMFTADDSASCLVNPMGGYSKIGASVKCIRKKGDS